MASVVEILLKAKDEVTGVIKKITGSFDGLVDGAEGASKDSGDAFGEMLDNFNTVALGISLAVNVAEKAYQALQTAYEATVGKTLEIAGEVETLTRISGEAPEDISKLLGVLQDTGLEADDLSKAFQGMVKNDIPPTIDSLVDLANQYLALRDPLDRAKFLTENFGKAGDDIVPMLEEIAGGIDAVSQSGPIFTETDIQNVRDYEEAISNLGGGWDTFVTNIGQKVTPAITGMILQLLLAKTAIENFNNIDPGDFMEAMGLVLNISGDGVVTNQDLIDSIRMLGGSFGETRQQIFDTSMTYEQYTKRLYAAGYANQFVSEEQWELAKSQREAVLQTKELGDATAETREMIEISGSNAKRARDQIDELTEGYKEMLKVEEQLANAQLELEVAIITFTKSVGSDLADGLEEALDAGELTPEEFRKKLGWIDQLTGTSFQMEYDMEVAFGPILQGLIDAGSFEEWMPAAQGFIDAFAPLQESVQAAQGKVDLLQKTLNGLKRQYDVDVNININVNGKTPSIPGGRDIIPDFEIGEGLVAAGGAVNAAMGLPHYWVGELGPEPFFPATGGRIVSNTQAMMSLRGGSQADAREIAGAVREGVIDAFRDRRVNVGGNEYVFNVTSDTSAAEIASTFDLLRAYGGNY